MLTHKTPLTAKLSLFLHGAKGAAGAQTPPGVRALPVSLPCPRPAPDPAAAPPLPPERPCRAAPPPAGGISSSAAAPRGPFFALPAAPMALCNGDTKVSAAAAGPPVRPGSARPGPALPARAHGGAPRPGRGTGDRGERGPPAPQPQRCCWQSANSLIT